MARTILSGLAVDLSFSRSLSSASLRDHLSSHSPFPTSLAFIPISRFLISALRISKICLCSANLRCVGWAAVDGAGAGDGDDDDDGALSSFLLSVSFASDLSFSVSLLSSPFSADLAALRASFAANSLITFLMSSAEGLGEAGAGGGAMADALDVSGLMECSTR